MYQNKCLRLILTKDRYEKIKNLHDKVAMVQDYINKIGQRFYIQQVIDDIDLVKKTMCLDN